MKNDITILDCMPAMADVVSGASSRPSERRKRENAFQWLKQSLVMARLEREFPEFKKRWPTIEYKPDVKPPASLGLSGFPSCYLMTWEAPPTAHTLFLFVNEDGTRCALVDPIALLLDTWKRLSGSPGRPRIETDNPKTLAQRKWRAKSG